MLDSSVSNIKIHLNRRTVDHMKCSHRCDLVSLLQVLMCPHIGRECRRQRIVRNALTPIEEVPATPQRFWLLQKLREE